MKWHLRIYVIQPCSVYFIVLPIVSQAAQNRLRIVNDCVNSRIENRGTIIHFPWVLEEGSSDEVDRSGGAHDWEEWERERPKDFTAVLNVNSNPCSSNDKQVLIVHA